MDLKGETGEYKDAVAKYWFTLANHDGLVGYKIGSFVIHKDQVSTGDWS